VAMDVKKIEGHGITVDAILINGTLKEKEKFVIMGMNGVIKS